MKRKETKSKTINEDVGAAATKTTIVSLVYGQAKAVPVDLRKY